MPALRKTNVWDFVFFVDPQVAKHFIIVIIEGHAIFPFFGDSWIKLPDVRPEKKQTAFYGF